MRLIDADLAMKIADTDLDDERAGVVQYVLLHTPTVNPEDLRKKGKWEEHDRYICNSDDEPVAKIGVVFICSECGRQEYRKEPYCHCGAKMEE